jgi:hypothetical protein
MRRDDDSDLVCGGGPAMVAAETDDETLDPARLGDTAVALGVIGGVMMFSITN